MVPGDFLGRVDEMSLPQICGDWLSIARRQTRGIVVLCRGFVNDAGTVKKREDGVSE